jgi:hypothetical protein
LRYPSISTYHNRRDVAMPDVKEFDITGKAMKGWVLVEP